MSVLSQKTQTVNKIGGFMHIILPNMQNEYDSYKIAVSDLLSGDLAPIYLENQTGNFNFEILNNCLIESCLIDVKNGTPIVRIGVTPAGQEILADFTLTEINNFFELNYLTESNGYIYVSVQNGYVDLRFDVINNYKKL